MRASTTSLLVIAGGLAVFGCGSDEGASTDATADTSTRSDAAITDGAPADVMSDASPTDATAPDAPAPTCIPTLGPGLTEETIEHDGQTRTFHLMIPSAHDGSSPLPLVFDIHGYTETADRQDGRSGMRALGEAEGFIVVQPEGSGALQSWNGGACCGTAASSDLDDVGLIRAIAADVSARACVDASRVYATGLSNGGFLSHRLACEASDLFAAIAPVAAVIGVPMETCTPEGGVGVMHVNGTADLLVPWDGNAFVGYPSVDATVNHWLDVGDCTAGPTETLNERRTVCETWTGCRDGAEVVLCTVERGGHEWPADSSGLMTSAEIWDFLRRHTR